MLDQRGAFLAALAANRYDQTTRLVFADWLEEQGLDDEALEHRRMASQEWVDAARWMEDLASKSGMTCTNYEWHMSEESEIWSPITFDMLVEAGWVWVWRKEHFVQMESETLRDMMRGKLLVDYWKNWRIITGFEEEIPGDWNSSDGSPSPFSCSC